MKLIPLFPLQLVVFPGEMLPLHIFEPRYKQMIKHCLDNEEPFGIASYIENKISKVGCLCRVEFVSKKYEDGRYDIVCRGGDRFLTQTYNSTKPYLQASVSMFSDSDDSGESIQELLKSTRKLFANFIEVAAENPENITNDDPQSSFEYGQLVGFDLAQKQNLLEIKSESERLKFIHKHLERSLPKIKKVKQVQQRIKSNGHFKHFPPIQFKP